MLILQQKIKLFRHIELGNALYVAKLRRQNVFEIKFPFFNELELHPC